MQFLFDLLVSLQRIIHSLCRLVPSPRQSNISLTFLLPSKGATEQVPQKSQGRFWVGPTHKLTQFKLHHIFMSHKLLSIYSFYSTWHFTTALFYQNFYLFIGAGGGGGVLFNCTICLRTCRNGKGKQQRKLENPTPLGCNLAYTVTLQGGLFSSD